MNEWFEYSPDTGILRWKKGRHAGKIAGSKAATGHLTARVNGKLLLVHRIIWEIVSKKQIPFGMVIDHINCNPSDNRLVNLRLATKAENGFNAKQQDKSIYKGVWFDKSRNNYQAYITANRKRIRIGRFQSTTLAIEAVKKARAQLHGEFARHGNA